MKIGIYGGTFDPPHNGHINICKSFLKQCELDKLYVVPAFNPPHKSVKSNVSSRDRFNMTCLAFSNISDKIEISDIEMKMQGKSYTSNTIKYFKNDIENEIYLLCGTDMFLTLDSWHEASYIFKNAIIVYARRENDENLSNQIQEKIYKYKKEYNSNIVKLNCDIVEISSTEIRKNIILENNASDFIPISVMNYIIEKNLYGDLPND